MSMAEMPVIVTVLIMFVDSGGLNVAVDQNF
jgi:hypothetical protein